MSVRLQLSVPKPIPLPAAMTALLTVAAASQFSFGQWTVANLRPGPGLPARAVSVFGEQQVGVVFVEYRSVILPRPTVWYGSAASRTDLGPWPYGGFGELSATNGTHQVGYRGSSAGLWSGTVESFVDLNPEGAGSSQATGISGYEQVGGATFEGDLHAGRWAGTAESWGDLHPAAAAISLATCTTGTAQGGWVTFEQGSEASTHASLWSGTAASWVDLNPNGSIESAVRGIFGDQQVGFANFGSGVHASLWSGAPETWVDLTPPGAQAAELNGAFANLQVGWASFADGHARAGLWTGTATSWIDLSAVLPVEFEDSCAYGVWSDGVTTRIVGSGYNSLTGSEEALMWSIPAPGALGVLGPLGLVAMRRARRNESAVRTCSLR